MYTPEDPAPRSTATSRRPRRAFLGGVAGALAALAGCLGGGGGSGSYEDWLSGIDNYDGTVDRTGTDRTTVSVGANDGLDFEPAGIEVDVGTTVVWEWTGDGGSHNVVARDDTFSSDYHRDAGSTFTYTFEETGEYGYYCAPHRNQGMRGGVAVR